MPISLNSISAAATASNLAETAVSKGPGSGNSVKSDRAQEAIEKFEGLFMSMMIKQLRETSSGEGLFPGDASDTYGGMFDMFLGDHLASAGSIGIGQLFRSSGAMMQLENYAMPTFAANADGRSKGIEEYQNEQLRSGAISALPAP